MPKRQVHVEKVCPYLLSECLAPTQVCAVSDLEDYSKRQGEASHCPHRGDDLSNRGRVGKYKMVKV